MSPEVVRTYQELLPFNEVTRNYTNKWNFPIPKVVVTKKFTNAFDLFRREHAKSPGDVELALLTGLTGHLAYNLDVNSAYEPAVAALEDARKTSPGDPRPGWFLGINRCETTKPIEGMQQLLQVEAAHPHLPADFWRDYALCAQIVNMPAHAVRAFENAKSLGASDPMDAALEAMEHKAIATGEPTKKYDPKQAWNAEKLGSGNVRFTSFLCGFRFDADAKASIDIRPIENGTCAVLVTPPGYLHEVKFHTPTLMVLTKLADPSEGLEAFADKLSHYRERHGSPVTLPCPVKACLSYEIRDAGTYAPAGGAHLLMVALSYSQATFPGSTLEAPHGPPTPTDNQPAFYRAEEQPRRFPGTMQMVIVMDASEAIYDHAKIDFEALLKSLVIDQ